jgi:ADP-heptose:LPS heptosyltransferase
MTVPPPGRGAKILVTRLRYLGDVILSLPLVASLRQALPECELHYLTEAGPAELLQRERALDRVWIAPRSGLQMLGLARRLRGERYSAAIDLFCNPRSALLVRATGAPVRIGEHRRARRHAYTLARRLVPGRSALEQHLDAMAALGLGRPPAARPVLTVSEEESARGAALWRRLASRPGVLLHVAATQPAKEWPQGSAVDLCRALEHDGFPVVLSSAPHRPQPSAAVADSAGVAHAPPLDLRSWLGFASHAVAVVSVDGAPVHAAVALGRPTVALFGPTDPGIWFPYAGFGPFRVLHAGIDCAGCDRDRCPERRCMAAIAPHAVREALQAVLAMHAGAA